MDKARRLGGRMSTHAGAAGGSAELGAQSLVAAGPRSAALLGPGGLQGLVAAAADEWVAPGGLESVLTATAAAAKAVVLPSHTVHALSLTDGAWAVRVGEDVRTFDAVVLTVPVPQILAMGGDVPRLIAERGAASALEAVRYSPAYTLVLFFSPSDVPAAAAALERRGARCAPHAHEGPAGSHHTTLLRSERAGHPALAQLCGDVRARRSIVAHSSAAFATEHMEAPREAVARALLSAVQAALPGLPQPCDSRCHRWRFASVERGWQPEGAADAPSALLLASQPPLVLAGDAFASASGGKGLEACAASAAEAAAMLRESWSRSV